LGERPEGDVLDDAVVLYRRISPDAVDSWRERPLHIAFRLRPSRGEESLSFYDAARVSIGEVLAGAPGADWLVAAVTAGDLRMLGFTVIRNPVFANGTLGMAHVTAVPPELVNGQILAELRQQLALACWLVEQ
jgi:hypothetical protein